jgi:TRAP-type C4-dicarboxylate transport system permease small subunit
MDRKRALLSLGGAVLFASLGFVMVFMVFAWLPYLVMTPSGDLSPAAEALLRIFPAPSRGMSLVIGPMMIGMAGMMPALIGLLRRRARSKKAR